MDRRTVEAAQEDAKDTPRSSPLNVLVFPCGSEVGLELYRSLRWATEVTLFGGSSASSDHGKYVYERYIGGLPFIDDPQFVEALRALVVRHRIDLIFPAMDCVATRLAEVVEQLPCRIVTSPVETCRICGSKQATYRRLAGVVRTPELFSGPEASSSWPVFLKPDCGYGSRGVAIARTPEEVAFHLKQNPSLLVLEYLPGPEYTVDCFTDRHGRLRFTGARERVRIRSGISVHSRTVSSPEFTLMAEKINSALRFRGVWFFQVKRNKDGDLTLMEVASRMAGTMALYRTLGVNFAVLSILDAIDMDVEVICDWRNAEIDRALESRFNLGLVYEHVYIDLEDCLICEGQVNTDVVAYLFQCINRGVRLHLITRLGQDVANRLRCFRLDNLWDEVHSVPEHARKSDVIRERNAIYITGSHADRVEVRKSTGLPTFTTDAVEALWN